jgi:hypothetical protein
VAGPEESSVRTVCEAFARRLNTRVAFTGREEDDALLSNGTRGWALLGTPRVDVARMVDWTADWIRRGGDTLARPTHFESRAGQF